MRMFNAETGELVRIDNLERRGSTLIVKGTIFGAMPMEAELRPEEVRKALKLLNFKLVLFLLTLPFRRSTGAETQISADNAESIWA
ncbi:hypothetical protein [Flavisphingomonas formosensis]|uniref:hypothetical protein n=1 Tax=Flavisphingomonas formosensis TaxID=861534 RepID=UPI00065C9310|nr:hypothetical protein [Sphingomonas formosensis]